MIKHMGIIAVSLVIGLCLFAGEDHYSLAFNAWYHNKHEEAIQHMRISYEANPNSNKLVWYMYFLETEKRFEEMINVMEKAPHELWVDTKYYTETYRHYAEALRQTGRREEAVGVLIEAIDMKTPDIGKNVLPLVQWVWTESYLSYEFKKHKRYHEILSNVITQLKKDWNEHSYVTRHLFDFCITAAAEEIAHQNKTHADFYIDTAIEISEKSDINKNDYYQPAVACFFDNAVTFWHERYQLQKQSAYKFTILCVWYPRIKAHAVYKGEELYLDYELRLEHIENKMREIRSQLQAVSLAYFYMSQGKLLFTFDVKLMDGTITEVEGINSLTPVIDSIVPDPGMFYYETFNKYDGYFHFYPKIPSNFLGARKRMVFVPYYIYSEYYRHHCWLLCGAYYG
jgi:tetratricopeptide (TPR) repeat protein